MHFKNKLGNKIKNLGVSVLNKVRQLFKKSKIEKYDVEKELAAS